MAKNRKDQSTRRGYEVGHNHYNIPVINLMYTYTLLIHICTLSSIQALIYRRKRLMVYLKRTDFDDFKRTVTELDLVKEGRMV